MPAESVSPVIDAQRMAELQQWQGRSEVAQDVITAAPMRGLAATLDRDDPPPMVGTQLPPLWHWLYFLPQHRQSELGPDGHARRGGFLPPVPLPRRMWAGGRLRWHVPLRMGDAVRRLSRIESITHKSGRSGELVFVLVRHEVHSERGLALTEEHDIVYRGAPAAGEPAPSPRRTPQTALWQREIAPDDVLLFRYSALTFNGHRIHYDRRYVTEIERYPGLIVHGPLVATLLVDLLRRERPDARLESFSFKATRPLFDLHPFKVKGGPADANGAITLWAEDHEGWLAMEAEATLALNGEAAAVP